LSLFLVFETCWSFNSQLFHLNSTCEFSSSIWHFSLLKFCCKWLVHLYASLVCTSWKIVDVTWSIMWDVCFFCIHKCLCFDWKRFLGVTNYWSILSTPKFLFMAAPFYTCSCTITWSNYLLKLLITILFSISPCSNSNLNKLMH
jgi:hypothetical protein